MSTKRINEDHKKFIDVISGRTQQRLKHLFKTGTIVRARAKGGKILVNIPKIDIPHITFGDNGKGLGKGPGKVGDLIGKDPPKGQGSGGGQGDHAEGFTVAIDLEDILKFMKDELDLPPMKPKPNQTFDEIKIKYNNISKIGPESLRHTRRTMQEALKRVAINGDLGKQVLLPGRKTPTSLILPINSDRRYRQFREIKIPSTKAVIFFARDCSGSMTSEHCDVISDMAWWIDVWIRQFYSKVERCYFTHDTTAEEVDEQKFYSYRGGGGTRISSVFTEMSRQLENRFPPDAYNIYVFYFSDGDNWGEDNLGLIKVIQEKFSPSLVNFIGYTQILSYGGNIADILTNQKFQNLKVAEIQRDASGSREEQTIAAIKKLLGKKGVTTGSGN